MPADLAGSPDGVTATWTGGGGFGVMVHGGAGAPDGDPALAWSGCRAAAEAARSVLAGGGSALDAVERAVVVLEDDPRYNAGVGAALTEDGAVELDASIMEGRRLRAGAVCTLRGVKNAIRVARAALEDGRHVFYSGGGALALARLAAIPECDPGALVTDGARARLAAHLAARAEGRGGTVGAVALDRSGSVAAATSTGGTTGKRRGRVGDSPVVGGGTYAEDGAGAGSATGHGEGILRVTLTARAIASLRQGVLPEVAAREALSFMASRVGATGGIILVDGAGRLAWARSTPAMPWAAAWDGTVTGGV